jgi:iron(III) transport system ATP-binding protein
MNTPQLAISGLCKSFGEGDILVDVSLQVAAGERWSIQGPSGTGKTTLLRIIAGLELPDRGRVEIDGRLATDGNKLRLQPWRRGVQMVFQDLGLWPTRSVLQNVSDARRAAGLTDPKKVAMETLDALGLGALLQRRPAKLSGGEARRLAFARALAMEPQLLLLDEPFASLDSEARHAGFDLLDEVLARTSAAVILVTHDAEEAARLGGRSAHLEDGVLRCS